MKSIRSAKFYLIISTVIKIYTQFKEKTIVSNLSNIIFNLKKIKSNLLFVFV